MPSPKPVRIPLRSRSLLGPLLIVAALLAPMLMAPAAQDLPPGAHTCACSPRAWR